MGRNVNTPSVTSGKEGYYTRFYAFGSTRNITQDYKGSNTNNIVNKRLTLDPVKYPNGYKDIRSDLKDGEVFSKVLIFDEIYPSSKLTISDVRSRLMYRLDEKGNKIQIGTDKSGNPIYDQYSIWYFQIPGFVFNNSEYDKETNPDGMKIPDKYLSVNFQTGALAGCEFELVYHDSAKKETSTDGLAFQVKAGDYEIKFIEEDSLILPMMTGLVPADTDKVILFNIKMPAEYTTSAYVDLESALDKEIERLSSDLNNYQFQSNPVSFYNSNPGLSIGQAVTYKNGNYSYSTRVIKLVTKIDYDCEQAITIGNEKVKGNTQELKEEVASANKDLNLLAVLNETTASLQQSFNRIQQSILGAISGDGKGVTEFLKYFARLDGYNEFTGNNFFKGGIAIDNPSSELSIQSNSVGVASLRYSNACFELKNIKSNKSLQLHDDGRFEFDGNKILTAKNFEDELSTVYVTLKTTQSITGRKNFYNSIYLYNANVVNSQTSTVNGAVIMRNLMMTDSSLNNVLSDVKNATILRGAQIKFQNVNGNDLINIYDSQTNFYTHAINRIGNFIESKGWFQNDNDGKGLYNSVGNAHFYYESTFGGFKSDKPLYATDLDANNNIQTLNFASGWAGAGCRIDNNGKAECSDLFVRGSLNVYELVINQIRGTNGVIAVSDVAELEEDSTTNGDRWYCEHLKGQGIANWISPFKVGDIVKCQRWNGKTVVNWISEVTNADNSNFMIAKNFRGIAIPQPKKGDVVIRWNSSDANRKGLLYLTASDSNAPYMDVMHDEKTRVRLGRLDGISGLSGYGIVGRDNSLNNIFHISSNGTASIAGWTFDNAKFKGGNLESVASGIIRHTGGKYSLNNDGSGQLANGNISWDAAGKVTFGNSVSLEWTNGISAAQNTANAAKSTTDTAKSTADSAKTTATTANSTANAAKSTATTANNTANNANTQAINANELALAMAFGKMLYRDPTFYNGNNDINLYNNSGNGNVIIERVGESTAPNDSKIVLKIQNKGAASPGLGGFSFSTRTSYRKVLITRIIAKIPSGRKIEWASNATGDGRSSKWLTSRDGTGDWKEYVYKVVCGTGGAFSTTNYFYIDGSAGTSSNPVVWYLAYATVFDVTSTEKYTTTIDANGIYTGTLTAGQVNAVAINAGSITTGTLNAGRIASRSITADKIQAGSLTATEINVSSLFSNMITTNNITITQGGRIGNFMVTSDGSLNNEYGYGSIYLRNNFKQTSLSPGFLSIQCTSGSNALFINRADQTGGDVIMRGGNGVFDFASSLTIYGAIKGLRFNARRISSSTTLTNDDVWVTFTNSSTISVYLPANPPLGKVLFVKKTNAFVNVYGNGKSIRTSSIISPNSFQTTGKAGMFIFDGSEWQAQDMIP